MIFKKFLKGTDLEFDICLEKTDYTLGDTVKGKVTLHTGKGAKAKQVSLFAEGKESILIKVEESRRYGISGSEWDTNTYSEVNTFFSEDLSYLLQKSVSNVLEDGALEIPLQTKEIAVEFILPSDNRLFSSYKGKHANITYTLKATLDIAKKLDVNKEEIFSVFNPNNNKVSGLSSNEDDNGVRTENENISFPVTSTTEKMDNNKVEERYLAHGKESGYSSTKRGDYPAFHGMGVNLDLGTLLTKGREKYLKENSEARIELLNHENNKSNSNLFSPGQTLRGKLMPLTHQNPDEERGKKNIKGIEITLSDIEHSFAQGFQRVSTIEKYEKKFEVNAQRKGYRENDTDFLFEFIIPNGIRQSYIGRYSEYFWGLEAKINIAWSSDIIARTIIEIT